MAKTKNNKASSRAKTKRADVAERNARIRERARQLQAEGHDPRGIADNLEEQFPLSAPDVTGNSDIITAELVEGCDEEVRHDQ